MQISGKILIGKDGAQGTAEPFRAFNPSANESMEPEFYGASAEQVALACELAGAAFDSYRNTSLEQRVAQLETELQQTRQTLHEALRRLEARFGEDLNGDNRVG